MCLPPRSDEAHDGAGERGAEPEHPPGQHPETVRGWEEQDSRQTSQREAGTAATEKEGGSLVSSVTFQLELCNSEYL